MLTEDELLASAVPLIRSLASSMSAKYAGMGVAFDDLYADGLYGAFLAARSFDPAAGTQFTTWAYAYVTRYMTLGVRFARKETTRGAGLDETSLDGLREQLSDDGTADFDLADESAEVVEEAASLRVMVRDAVRRLPPRSRHVVYLTHWLGKGPTEAGRLVGVSKTRARQILGESYERLRGQLAVAA